MRSTKRLPIPLGILALALTINSAHSALIHQWLFEEIGGAGTTLVDSVGNADGTIIDNGNLDGSVGQGQVTLTGGAKGSADYVQFPSGLLEGLDAVSIETWSTEHSVQNWSRVFSFGSGANVTNAWFLSWSRGTGKDTQRMEKQGIAPADSGLVTELGTQYHFVATWDPNGGVNGNGRYEWFRDGALVTGTDTNGVALSVVDDAVMWLGRSQWGDNTANASWDEFRIYDEVLTQQQITDSFIAGPTPGEDSDNDGIPDSIENQFAFLNPNDPNDAALDQDNDGLDNLGEVQNGTDLENPDTDGDSVSDGDEVNRMVGGQPAPTKPLEVDTDGDGLSDGVETNTGTFVSYAPGNNPPITDSGDTGTDPLDPDTDGDLVGDGAEVSRGSDPTDPNSKPRLQGLIHRWNFDEPAGPAPDGATFADSVGGADGAVRGDGAKFTGTGLDLPGGDSLAGTAAYGDLPNGLISSLTDTTFEGWVTVDSASGGNWTRLFDFGSTQPGGGLNGEVTGPGNTNGGGTQGLDYIMLSAARGGNYNQQRLEIRNLDPAGGGINTFDTNVVTVFGQEIHFAVTVKDLGNGTTEINYWRDGVQQTSGEISNTTLSEINDVNNWLGRSTWLNDGTLDGTFDEFRIYDKALTPEEVADSIKTGKDIDTGGAVRVTDVNYDGSTGNFSISWESAAGKIYNLRSETDPSAGERSTWPIFDGNQDLAATPPENTLTFPLPADSARFFVIEEYPAPPVVLYDEDFEPDEGGWTTGVDGDPGSDWELGTPTSIFEPASGAHSGVNCFGTIIGGTYSVSANVWLLSPEIDLTTAAVATLSYFEFRDIDDFGDSGSITIFDAADDSLIAVLEADVTGLNNDWAEVTFEMPAAALGKTIQVEFRFTSDPASLPLFGWYIDDVLVTEP
jgi:hypothetical protein